MSPSSFFIPSLQLIGLGLLFVGLPKLLQKLIQKKLTKKVH
jgi:hypothetical protein